MATAPFWQMRFPEMLWRRIEEEEKYSLVQSAGGD
jgi:hypothetical protein